MSLWLCSGPQDGSKVGIEAKSGNNGKISAKEENV